jgi:hypothetical protein
MNIPIVRQEDAFNLATILRLKLCNLKLWSKVCFAVHCNRSELCVPAPVARSVAAGDIAALR